MEEKSLKIAYHKLLVFVFFSLPIYIFFARLFVPTNSIFMIPDFGESDVLHLNLPFKEILSRSLKAGEWPVWTPLLAGGFPILAEGQIGTFYLPNLVLFRFLPTVSAYNINLVIAFLLAPTGTYLFAKMLKFSSISSFFAAFIFTFSGFLSVHLNHFNLIQAASLLPLLFCSTLLLWEKPSLKFSTLFAFILSQQIFTGHFYIVFISLAGIVIFLLFQGFTSRNGLNFNILITKLTYLLGGLTLAVLLSNIQLLPTLELWKMSGRSNGLNFDTITSYPYPYKHLLTFLNPYWFGNPAKGSYPPFDTNWGIFWENTAYIGLLPLLLSLSCIFFLKDKLVKIFWSILFISLLIVLGKFSPLYFIFSFPPFNFFRVPSKFLLLTTFSLAILSGYMVEMILIKVLFKPPSTRRSQRKIFYGAIIFIIFSLIFLDEYRFSYNYPPVSPSKYWTEIPETAQFLQEKKGEGRLKSIGAPLVWNSVFLKKGWQDISPFTSFRNSLYPNYNVFFSISQININTGGLVPRRISHIQSMVNDITIDKENNIATLSAISKNAMSLSNVSFLISSYKIAEDKDVSLLATIKPSSKKLLNNFYYIYKNETYLPKTYISYKTETVTTLEDIYRQLAKESFLEEKKVLVEDKDLELSQSRDTKGSANIIDSTDTEILIETKSDADGVLVLTDSNYSGWQAHIDEKPTDIFTVNLDQKGVKLPKGNHLVRFKFRSKSFETGKFITILSWTIIFLAVFLSHGFSPRKVS